MQHIYKLVILINLLVSCHPNKFNDNLSFPYNKEIYSSEKLIDHITESTLEEDKSHSTNVKLKNKFCFLECPSIIPQNNLLIKHEEFILSYNIKTKYADWIAYKINPFNLSGPHRQRVWQADPKLNYNVALFPSDYKDSYATCKYDRGHQAPLADFSNNKNWQETNYLSNITPQKSNLNRGAWSRLENKIRLLSKKFANQNIYILTGVYYDGQEMCKLPNARITNIIPNGYWKIVTLIKDKNVYSIAFVFDQNTSKNSDYCKHETTINYISELTKLNFGSISSKNSPFLMEQLGCNNRH